MPSYTHDKPKRPVAIFVDAEEIPFEDHEIGSKFLEIDCGMLAHQYSNGKTESDPELGSDGGNPNSKSWKSELTESMKDVYLGVLYAFATIGLLTLVLSYLDRVEFDFDFSSKDINVQVSKIDAKNLGLSRETIVAAGEASGLKCVKSDEFDDDYELL